MSWKEVGGWLKDNAGAGATLVGSLLTGNVPGAVAAGVSLVSGATGTDDPAQALHALQSDPATVAKLKELYYANEADVRRHVETIKRLELEDQQTTQATIQAGDRAEDPFVRRTRPGQSWLSLLAAFAYVFTQNSPDILILSALLTLPWAYAGLRQVGKGIDSVMGAAKARKF